MQQARAALQQPHERRRGRRSRPRLRRLKVAGQCYSNEDVASERTVRGVKRTYSLSNVQDQGNGFVIVGSVSRLGRAGEGHI